MPKEPLDHLRSQKKPVTRSIRILTDYDVGEEWDRRVAEASKWEARVATSPLNDLSDRKLGEAKAAVDEYRPIVEQNSILFKFRSIGRKKNERLRLEHPATPEQIKEFEEAAGNEKLDRSILFNPDTYPTALIAASMIEPDLGPSDIENWLKEDTWSEVEITALFQCAMEANNTRKIVELGKG